MGVRAGRRPFQAPWFITLAVAAVLTEAKTETQFRTHILATGEVAAAVGAAIETVRKGMVGLMP